jgi:dTDP-4-dehydrorhamnose 3,5-epimerase
MLESRQDRQSITADWQLPQDLIAGVRVKEVRNVVKNNGDVLCEVFRRDWLLDEGVVDQVFQVAMNPGVISGWHSHRTTTDRLFVSQGVIQIVLYDSRIDSGTCGRVNEFRFGTVRPALVTVPPAVWHAVRNLSSTPSVLLNLTDRSYAYEDPDHWRLPLDTEQIPYRFE